MRLWNSINQAYEEWINYREGDPLPAHLSIPIEGDQGPQSSNPHAPDYIPEPPPEQPNGPALTMTEANAKIEQSTAPRVTETSIRDKIVSVQYITHEVMTICIIGMRTGYNVVGTSSPISRANYKKDVGERIAYDNAFRQLWPLEGYLLGEQLYKTDPSANAVD